TRPLATRGERLSLHGSRFEGNVAQGGGPLSFEEHLCLVEVAADGRFATVDLFDWEDLDAAYVELQTRYEAGEAAMHRPLVSAYVRAFAERDWDAIAALYPPTFGEIDRRTIALTGTAHGARAWTQDRVLVDLAPDTRVRFDHIRNCPGGFLSHVTFYGSRDGAQYELVYVIVSERDESGEWQRNDVYDPEQLDQAWARFEVLNARESLPRDARAIAKPNAAAATMERWQAAYDAGFDTGDWS